MTEGIAQAIVRVMQLSTFLRQQRGRIAYIAGHMGWAPAYLSQMAAGRRPVPVERAAELERMCGFEVRRWDLFPDRWSQIWPELVGTEGAPAPADAEMRDAA